MNKINETEIMNRYELWLEKATADQDVVKELEEIAGDKDKIEEAFYRNLAFGTGGLRGVIGAGTNRMNVHTVAKASQGLADYVNKSFPEGSRSIAVSYDSRIKSDLFAKVASCVFAANGIQVHMYAELMPTPCLSFAVRQLTRSAGIMITASHNPSKYNGYKVSRSRRLPDHNSGGSGRCLPRLKSWILLTMLPWQTSTIVCQMEQSGTFQRM